MQENQIRQFKAALQNSKKAVIIPHKNPDGDAIGSCVGLQKYLATQNCEAVVIAPNAFPDFLNHVPESNEILIFEYEDRNKIIELVQEADLVWTLDFNDLSRCGGLAPILEKYAKKFAMIDHHTYPSNYAGELTYSDVSMSSTCQMVYHFIEMMEDLPLIDKDMASCIYTGILTDTGSFRYRSTTSTTHRIIAHLIDIGVDNSQIHAQIYDTNSYDRLRLKALAINNLVILKDFKTAYITLSQKELNIHSYKKGDTDGFVNMGLSIKGVEFAVLFTEDEREGIIKISFRSKGHFKVNEFASAHFEGGGHQNASGGRSLLSLNETVTKFKSLLPKYQQKILES